MPEAYLMCEACLMPESYSKPCQISKMIKHIENPGIVSLFRHFQAYSGTFSNIQPCSGQYSDMLKHTEGH